MKAIAVLASGSGSNFEAITASCLNEQIPARVAGLLTNNPRAQVLERARRLGVPARVLERSLFENESLYDEAQSDVLREWQVDLVVLAGYLRKIGPRVLKNYSGKILNVHPSLLPQYGGKGMYGDKVFAAVLQAKETETGVTVHWVDAEYDRGAIIQQATIPIEVGDTVESLRMKTHQAEHRLYVDVLSRLCRGELK